MRRLALAATIILPVLAAGAQAEQDSGQSAAEAVRESVLDKKARWLILQDHVRNMGWGDFDLDGDADVALRHHAGGQQYLTLYRNEGGMTFTAYEVFQLPDGEVRQVLFEDVDGDRYPDLLLVRFRGPNSLNLNNGNAGFESKGAMIGLQADDSFKMVVSDIDGDGDNDLVVANAGKTKRYLNDGRGNFSPGRAINRKSSGARVVVAGDIDGDGDMDILLGTHAGHIHLYTNHGDGTFDADGIKITKVRMGSVRRLVLMDADGDGDLDLFATNNYDLEYFRNPGDGRFDAVASLDGSVYLEMRDMDLDGDIDIVTSPAQVILNGGPENWLPLERFVRSDNTREETLQDVDNDNDLDLVVLPMQGPGLKVYLNNTIVSEGSE